MTEGRTRRPLVDVLIEVVLETPPDVQARYPLRRSAITDSNGAFETVIASDFAERCTRVGVVELLFDLKPEPPTPVDPPPEVTRALVTVQIDGWLQEVQVEITEDMIERDSEEDLRPRINLGEVIVLPEG